MIAAATFCSTCSGEPEPGIGRICGDLASSQASASWRGLTPWRLAASRMGWLASASTIGAHGRNTSISCSHRSTIASEVRSVTL
jgi:hypothetical protein